MRRTIMRSRAPGRSRARPTLTMPFAPEYVRTVLNENFEDAKALFLEPLLAIHDAHLVMLAEQGIVAARRRPPHPRRARPPSAATRSAARPTTARCEDLFFFVERLIAERAGGRRRPPAHRPQPQRHRHDDVPDAAARASSSTCSTRRWRCAATLGRHRGGAPRDGVPGAHPHAAGAADDARALPARRRSSSSSATACGCGPPSPPPTDPARRLRHHRHRPSRSIAQRTSELLGFDGPTGNTYGSIATVDYLLESLSAASVALVGVGRVVQDLLLWCTAEFGYLRLGDGFVQVSSIMPQKRNPVALEHARSIGSKALGQATAVMLSVHNTPFGDIVDTEDDLQPLVHQTFRDAVARRDAGGRGAARPRTFDVAEMAPARGRGLHHRDRAGRHADARAAACRSRSRTPSPPAWSRRTGPRRSGRSCEQLADVSTRVTGARHRRRGVAAARDPQPVALRPHPRDARRAGAVAHGGRGARGRRGTLARDVAWLAATARARWPSPIATGAPPWRPCDARRDPSHPPCRRRRPPIDRWARSTSR